MGSGFKDWSPGDVLTAADVDGYLMRQTVMTFADASARDTALSGVLDEGMMAYLEDTNVTTYYDGSSWEDIRGLGGGSATSPGGFSSGDVLDAADMNGLPAGVVGYSQITSSVNPVTTSFQDVLSVTFTAVSGRRYLAHTFAGTYDPSTAQILDLEITDGSNTRLNATSYYSGGNNQYYPALMSHVFTASGSTTIKVRAQVSTSVAILIASANKPAFLTVVDLGET